MVRPGATGRPTDWAVTLGTGALAFCVRWNLGGGVAGLRAYRGYDDGVYFASAISFTHGLMPYRDFLMLHPPGITVALAPFALLTHWISDSSALAVARVAFMLVGAANTVLVSRLALRWGHRAAAVAGTLYAVAYVTASTENLTLLEPLGTLCLLGAVTLFLRASDPHASAWWTYAGGAVLGLGLVVKIWDVVPAIVVLGWLALGRGRATALRAGVAAAVAASAVLLPFGVVAGDRMVRLVVLDQVGRPRGPTSLVARLDGFTGVTIDARPWASSVAPVVLALVLAVVGVAAPIAWTSRRGRLWVVLLAAQVLVLALSPSYFARYSAYAAPALVLVVAAASSTLTARRTRALAGTAGLVLGVVTVALLTRPAPPSLAAEVSARLPESGCIRADAPGALILLDRMSRDLAAGCTVAVDLSGQTYDVGSRDVHGRAVPRVRNEQWQRDALRYLTSGVAAVLVRGGGDGFDASTRTILSRLTTARLPGVAVLMTPRPAPVLGPPETKAPPRLPS